MMELFGKFLAVNLLNGGRGRVLCVNIMNLIKILTLIANYWINLTRCMALVKTFLKSLSILCLTSNCETHQFLTIFASSTDTCQIFWKPTFTKTLFQIPLQYLTGAMCVKIIANLISQDKNQTIFKRPSFKINIAMSTWAIVTYTSC